MTTLMIELPSDLYARLHSEAQQIGRPVEILVEEWLRERLTSLLADGDRVRAREILRNAGLLTELGPALKQRAQQSTANLEEIQAAFARAGGQPLSEIVLEQRGPKR